jgi:hypothetical protein
VHLPVLLVKKRKERGGERELVFKTVTKSLKNLTCDLVGKMDNFSDYPF